MLLKSCLVVLDLNPELAYTALKHAYSVSQGDNLAVFGSGLVLL